MNTVLETCGLGRKYGRRWALRDCTLVIPAGRVVGLVGPNGAGKSTLLHLAVGLLEPTAGTIRVFGQEPGDNRALSRTGFVAQDTPVYARLSVAGHLRAGACAPVPGSTRSGTASWPSGGSVRVSYRPSASSSSSPTLFRFPGAISTTWFRGTK